MAVPQTVFIDTSIFEGCSFNFKSAAVSPILNVTETMNLKLLLPLPIEHEIQRHINERSEEVLAALVKAQKRAPFLRKWNQWPLKAKHEFSLSLELSRMARAELDEFLERFKLIKLGPSRVNVAEVIHWYNKGRPPFGKGKKKHEFPDALSLSAVLEYSRAVGEVVAVISSDGDHERFCGRHDCLFHYQSLGAFVESLLSSDEHVQKVREMLDENTDLIDEGIGDEFLGLYFYATDDESAHLEDVEIRDLTIWEINIIGTGDREVSVSFEAKVHFAVTATVDASDWDGPATRSETVDGYSEVSGIAKLKVSAKWDDFEDLELITLDNEEVGVEVWQDSFGRW